MRTRATWQSRTGGAALALLVQVLFLWALLFTTMRHAERTAGRETILILHPTPRAQPSTIDARGVATPRIAPVRSPLVPNLSSPAPPVLAAPSGIAGFGRSLFGCAPERYADLPPDEKARCPKPGEGLAVNPPPDLLNPPKSHAKYESLWQEELAERQWLPMCTGEVDVAKCLLRQDIAENHRAQAARQKFADDKAAALREPKRPMPRIGVRRN